MDRHLPDFKVMSLRERMDWLERAAQEGGKILSELSRQNLDPELKRLMKTFVKTQAEKPVDTSPLRDVKIDNRNLPKGVVRNTDGIRMRSADGKVSRFMRRNGDNFSDYADSDYSESPRDPVKVKVAVYKPRPNSPFKRAAKAASAVVIVRK